MYGPRTGGPGFWPPSSSLLESVRLPRNGDTTYEFRVTRRSGDPHLELYSTRYGKWGEPQYTLLRKYARIYEAGVNCKCQEVHETLDESYDCAHHRLVLWLLEYEEGNETTRELSRLAQERGHRYG